MTLLLLAKKALVAVSLLHSADLNCSAEAVFFESRGEPIQGQYAVAQVIQHRIHSPAYPDDACAVVHAPAAFSYYWDGKSERITDQQAYNQALIVSALVVLGLVPDVTGGADSYHALSVKPQWGSNYTAIIGGHAFCRVGV